MKIILLKDVAKVGQHGTVQEVADGYALNFLIARGLAVQATPEKVAAYAAAQKREGDARAEADKVLIAAIRSLEGVRIEITARATPKGGLFKSITTSDIVTAIADRQRAVVPEGAIQLAKPIKETGEHKITIHSGEAKAEITLAIIASA
jgi:large subunit ribosomal protein L9